MSDTGPSLPWPERERTPAESGAVLPVDEARFVRLEGRLSSIDDTHSRVGRSVATVAGVVVVGIATVVLLVYQNKERIQFMNERLTEHITDGEHRGTTSRVREVEAAQREDRAQIHSELAAIRTTLDEIKAQLNRQQERRRQQ